MLSTEMNVFHTNIHFGLCTTLPDHVRVSVSMVGWLNHLCGGPRWEGFALLCDTGSSLAPVVSVAGGEREKE